MRPETARWLAKATEDLEVARYLLAGARWPAAAFYAQQAGELALKALVVERSARIVRTHSLIVLAEEVKAPAEIVAQARRLTPAYVAQRYPDAATDVTEPESRELARLAEEVVRWVRNQLS